MLVRRVLVRLVLVRLAIGILIATHAISTVATRAQAQADTIRLAVYDSGLTRKGPGLLLRDIDKATDDQIAAVAQVIVRNAPDILLLLRIDYDAEARALIAFRDMLASSGLDFPHVFTRAPNSGQPTGLDLDGDGVVSGARDAQGFGWFPGQGGMAVLSRVGQIRDGRDFSTLLWRDLPDADLGPTGARVLNQAAMSRQRLSSTGHWQVSVNLPRGGALHLLTYHATPPVFDGPEDRNGRRNADETRLWLHWLNGRFGPVPNHFVIMGNANLDPLDGEGRTAPLTALLQHPRIQDPRPASAGGQDAARRQKGANSRHHGNPALDTADWRDDPGPGNLRVDYILPAAGLRVIAAGVDWPPASDPALSVVKAASPHRLVWVDIATPGPP